MILSIVPNKLNGNLKSNKNISFKNSMDITQKKAIDNQFLKKSYKEQQKAEGLAAIIGVGVGALTKLAGIKKPLNKAIGAYFISLITLLGAQGLKEEKQKVDFGDEEKNKQYQEIKNKEKKENLKYSIIPSFALGALMAVMTGLVCFAKKVPDKLDKILTSSLITTTPALLISNLILNNKNTKEQTKQ